MPKAGSCPAAQIEMHALEKEKDDKASRQRLEEVKAELAVSVELLFLSE